jgi:hypothetical protein
LNYATENTTEFLTFKCTTEATKTKHIKTLTPETTLETPVWGKPTKRGFYWL